MARGIEGNEISSTKPSAPQKATPSGPPKNQKTILGFFQKKESSPALPKPQVSSKSSFADLTPVPSSDPVRNSSPVQGSSAPEIKSEDDEHGLPSPISPHETSNADLSANQDAGDLSHSTPVRKGKKNINYAESDTEDLDDGIDFKPQASKAGRARSIKRRKVVSDDSDDSDEFKLEETAELGLDDDDLEDFIVPDDSDEEPRPAKKRKRLVVESSSKPSLKSQSPPMLPRIPTEDQEIPETSTARQWTYDPEKLERLGVKPAPSSKPKSKSTEKKQKAHTTEPDKRYTWLADLRDAERHRPDHPDYDPRTVYIPPLAWTDFSPFERQYWEIKQNFWNTIVFFKKGKFYELYENDATIGHQLFDLKLTDRVNMRMVGVPESSLDHWARQFVSHGYKIARVDQMENALGKEMRERDEKAMTAAELKKKQKEEKVIRRELSSVLTSGTLVDGGMLEGDMATFCAAIKEEDREGLPAFGIAFVDTATAQFHLVEFVDDPDFTKFETFVAQTRPAELLIEKGCLSTKATRILKSNTPPTTIWNFLKPIKEFWPADITAREIDTSGYFVSQDVDTDATWPAALSDAKDKELLISAFGALVQYLRTLKIDRELVSLGNFQWYDPIRKATSLVLDGQSLINLEIFANSFDGTSEGTIFAMLNRCVTPFGKRMLRQWVCHPLADADRINARFDAVDALNADFKTQDTFTSSLSKLPDLERLISRVHAGRCKADDFVKVLDGFEQIEYTMSLLSSFGSGDGLLGQLLSSMPDLAAKLIPWKTAFKRELVKDQGILVPEPGVEEDFDEAAEAVDRCEQSLQDLLRRVRKELGSSAICFKDVGKEIFQLEVPIKIKNIPKTWDQMSSTSTVKRYYSAELRKLVRELQEARETHSQIAREVASRFYRRFDGEYASWLAAVKVISQLDCLISLARASKALGTPSCRPTFVEGTDRSMISFVDLRHPTMLTTVSNFIPNDICLGGAEPNLNLLTGANAAGKSTVLRMTCVAVILAQLGCYVPCESAILTAVDRIMSRLGANDNILQQQSTFFVELAETKKILTEATPRSLVIVDELGRGTSSVDGLAVAEAVLHHIAGSVGCTGFFATHYHSLAHEFAQHPEVQTMRMAIDVDEAERRVTFLYRLEQGVAEGSFGMHCASMCGIPSTVVDRAENAAEMWEHSGRVKEALDKRKGEGALGLGWLSDLSWMLRATSAANVHNGSMTMDEGELNERALAVLAKAIESL